LKHKDFIKEVELSEFIEEQIVKRIVAGREGGNVLSVTNFSDRIEFSISNGSNSFSVSLTRPTFDALLNWMEYHDPSVEIPRNISSSPEKSEYFKKKKESSPKMKARRESRIGVPVNLWTSQQISEMVRRHIDGESNEEISKHIPRSSLAIRDKLRSPAVVKMISGMKKKEILPINFGETDGA